MPRMLGALCQKPGAKNQSKFLITPLRAWHCTGIVSHEGKFLFKTVAIWNSAKQLHLEGQVHLQGPNRMIIEATNILNDLHHFFLRYAFPDCSTQTLRNTLFQFFHSSHHTPSRNCSILFH